MFCCSTHVGRLLHRHRRFPEFLGEEAFSGYRLVRKTILSLSDFSFRSHGLHCLASFLVMFGSPPLDLSLIYSAL